MEPTTIGVLWAFAGAFCWACTNIFIRRASLLLDPFIGVYWTLWINLACALVVLAIVGGGADIFDAGWGSIAIFVFIGLIQYPIARLVYYFAIRYIGATRTAGITSIQAAFTAILAVWFLGEEVTLRIALGTLLTMAGVYVMIRE